MAFVPNSVSFDALRALRQSVATPTSTYIPTTAPRLGGGTPQLSQAQADLIAAQRNAIKRVLSDPNSKVDRNKLMADLQRIASGKEDDGGGGLLGIVGKGFGKGLQGIGYVLGRPLALVASAGKELTDIPSGKASFGDFIEQTFDPTTSVSKFLPKSGNGWIDGIVGFIGDVALDPLTYVTFGASAFAGRAGRLALAAKAAEKANLEKIPGLLTKVENGSIARLGEWALTAAEKEALGIKSGVSWAFRSKAVIGEPGSALGKLSEKAAKVVGGNFAKGRAKVGDIPIFRPLQEVTSGKYVREAGLSMYGRVKDSAEAGDILKKLAGYSSTARSNGAGRLVQLKYGSKFQDLATEVSAYEQTSGRRIHEVIENVRPAADETEQALATRISAALAELRDEANKTTADFASRRNANAYQIGSRENYVPHTLTPEAKDLVARRTYKEGSRMATNIKNMLGISPSELKFGPGPLRARKLKRGTKWLGETLETSVDGLADGPATMAEINRISRDKLGFDWFEVDGAQYLSNYLDSVVSQTKRIAFADRLFDYGADVARTYGQKVIPDKGLARSHQKFLGTLDKLQDDIVRGYVSDVAADTEDVLAPRIAIARSIVDSRPGDALLSPEQMDNVITTLDRLVSDIAEADGIARGASTEVREAYETMMAPLRVQVADMRAAVDANDQEFLAAVTGLRDLYQRIFPDADGIPGDPRALAEDIVDGISALRGVMPDTAGVADQLASTAERAARGLEVPTPSGAVYATPEDARRAVANLEEQLRSRQANLDARLAAEQIGQELPGQVAASVAREDISRLENEISDIAARRDEALAQVEAKRTEAGQIIEQQRQLFGAESEIGGRSVFLPEARKNAANFMESKGRSYNPPSPTVMTNPTLQSEMAKAYNRMPTGIPDPNTRAGKAAYKAYAALKKDIEEQYRYLTETLGIKIEFVEGDPYATTADMFIDIQNNKRLKIWSGESENPMLTHEENLKLRAVHDYFGHASVGVRFDRNGEERAFLHHIQMFSPEARPAAATEFRGQTAYLIEYGTFGPQKGYLLPKKFWGPDAKIEEAISGLRTTGGHTVDLTGKDALPTSGYQVSLGGPLEKSVPASEINSVSDVIDRLYAPFLADKKTIRALAKKNQFFGTYYSGKSDLVYAEVSKNYASIEEAYWQAVRGRQESILDWADLNAGNSGEIFTVDLINAKEKDLARKGRKLSDEELLAREELQKRAAEERAKGPLQPAPTAGGVATYPNVGATGGIQDVVRGSEDGVRYLATDASGRTGTARLAGLPEEPLTPQQVEEILTSGSARLKEIGYTYGEPTRTPAGTRVSPLDKEAKNVRVSAQRKTARRQQEIDKLRPAVDAVTPLNIAREQWDSTVGAVYLQDVENVIRLVGERPLTGAAAEMTAEWLTRMVRTLEQLNAPGLALKPAEREAFERVLTATKGLEARLAVIESERNIATEGLDRVLKGELGGKIKDDILDGWERIQSLGIQIPPELRDVMFERVRSLDQPLQASKLYNAYKEYTKFFKVAAMLTPGFLFRNSYTAAFNNFVAGVTLGETREGLRFARNIMKNGLDAALASVPAGKRPLYERALQVAYSSGAGQTADDILAPVIGGQGKRLNKIIESKPVKKWSETNEAVEVAARFSLALSSLNRGMDYDAALMNVSRYHFDYTDVSKADEFMRAWIPFWTFASRNIPLQIVNQVARPSLYRRYEALRRNFGVSEEDQTAYPSWLTDRRPLQFPGMGPGSVINPDLPFIDMEEQSKMFTDPMRLLSQANPLVKLPIELAGGRQLYQNIPFKEGKVDVRGPLDWPAYLTGMLTGSSGTRPDGGAYTTSRVSYAIPNLIPTLAQLQRILPELGGKETYMDRSTSSRASYIGVPYRRVSDQEQFNELLRRQFAIKNYLSNLTRTGYITPKER